MRNKKLVYHRLAEQVTIAKSNKGQIMVSLSVDLDLVELRQNNGIFIYRSG